MSAAFSTPPGKRCSAAVSARLRTLRTRSVLGFRIVRLVLVLTRLAALFLLRALWQSARKRGRAYAGGTKVFSSRRERPYPGEGRQSAARAVHHGR